jgi:hypothetical protein
MDGCRLRDWPPLSGTFGPVKPDANGRVLFSGAGLRAQTVRRLTIECDLADLLPVGPTDGYAVDVGSGMQAVVVNGTTRTPMDLSIVSQNGSNPSAKVSVSCGHRITADAGTVSTVRARPTFALAADSPGGTKSRGYIVIAKYTVTASACEGLSLTRVKVKITYSDNSSTGWGDRVFQNSLARLALSTSESQAWGTQTFADKTSGSFTLATDATTAPLLVPAGQSRTFSVLMDVNEASTNTHDTVRVFPQDPVGWYGQDNPSGYPALAKAPDFVAAASVAISF